MLKKVFLVAAFIAAPLLLSNQTAEAGGGIVIGYGSPGYGYGLAPRVGYGGYIGPRVAVQRALPYRPSSHYRYSSHYAPVQRYPVNRYHGGGGYYGGYGRSCPNYGYRGYGYGRSGISLRIGF